VKNQYAALPAPINNPALDRVTIKDGFFFFLITLDTIGSAITSYTYK